MPAEIGALLNGRYRLESEIGRGGMGRVYCAHDTLLDRHVAVKVLSVSELGAEGRARLLREAQAVAKLNHPNIVSVYDAGEAKLPDSVGTVPFIVMELVEGASLHDCPPGSLDEILGIACEVCTALDHAHTHGVIHRDLKPENVLVAPDGCAKLVDFGLARTVASRLTAEGAILGTIYYIAPEQALGQEIDGRADLYAMGVMLYEWTTGRLPFEGDDALALIGQHLHAPVMPPREHNPEIPHALDALIVQLMSKRPEDRPASAVQARQVLEALVQEPVAKEVSRHGSHLPGFLAEAEERKVERPAFVARERELAWLDHFLDGTLAGSGRVVFAIGGPGRGKTALLDAFARQAMGEHHELLVASGTCNAYSGVGDPYLPFREALGMLTGDVEARWAAGAISRDHGLRLWGALPATVEALLTRGPHVVPALVPGEALLARASAACPAEPWLGRLRERVQRGPGVSEGLEQSHLFQQVSNVLRALAEEHPLLLILDDLQWVDRTSAGLLFHLGRRLEGARILIAGTYRPEEIAPDRQGEPHPLEKVLAEFKRTFGDVWLDLAEGDAPEGRRFVDALLETEPNCLGEGFRQALAERAEGHPLFTVELLRSMQERGDLVQDEEGCWVEGPALDWDLLPARVEGAIGERIERLEEDLRQILTVASVEGEDFTAEVVAQVQSLEARALVRRLSGELQREHRLVRAQGLRHLDARRLALYRFQHHLFQKYLYNHLDSAERAYLHEDVGTVLEALYGEQTDEVAVQLARHFLEAGVTEKAAHYLGRSGMLAAEQYANEEAIAHYSRALELVPEADAAGRYGLLLARQKVYHLLGRRDAQRQDLAELETLAQDLGAEHQAEVAIQLATYANTVGDYLAALSAAQLAVERAQTAECSVLQAQGQLGWATALFFQADWIAAREHAEAALLLAREARLTIVEAKALNCLGCIADESGSFTDSRHFLQALHLYQQIDDTRGAASVLYNLGVNCCQQGDYAEAWSYFQRTLRLSREAGDRSMQASALRGFGEVHGLLGDYTKAQEYYEQSLRLAHEIEHGFWKPVLTAELAESHRRAGDYATARAYAEQALDLFHEAGTVDEYYAIQILGDLSREAGDPAAAREWYVQALDLLLQNGLLPYAMGARAGLASLTLALGDTIQAQAHVAEILAYLDAGNELMADAKPLWIYLTCHQVLQTVGDPRATEILSKAYHLLQERAARLPDESMRRSFLENVEENREILRLAQEAGLAT